MAPAGCGVTSSTQHKGLVILHADTSKGTALTGVAQWVGCCTKTQKVTGSILSGQGTSLGCRPGPHLRVCKVQQMNVSLSYQSFSPSLPPFLSL